MFYTSLRLPSNFIFTRLENNETALKRKKKKKEKKGKNRKKMGMKEEMMFIFT